jgi:S-phase kinase-associated protein 1
MATVITCDNRSFDLHPDLVNRCETLVGAIEATDGAATIPLPNVDSSVLKRIIDYHDKRKLESHEDMTTLLLACDFLAYEELLDHGCKIVADSLRGKSAGEIRSIFGLEPTAQAENQVQG